MTSTLAPKRAQTEPSSRPIAPAPITTSEPGTCSKLSASVLVTITLPSAGANGRAIGTLPVAMMMCLASSDSLAPSAFFTLTKPGFSITPWPK